MRYRVTRWQWANPTAEPGALASVAHPEPVRRNGNETEAPIEGDRRCIGGDDLEPQHVHALIGGPQFQRAKYRFGPSLSTGVAARRHALDHRPPAIGDTKRRRDDGAAATKREERARRRDRLEDSCIDRTAILGDDTEIDVAPFGSRAVEGYDVRRFDRGADRLHHGECRMAAAVAVATRAQQFREAHGGARIVGMHAHRSPL